MGRQDYETETMIAHALRGEGFDASEDGAGRGTPIVPTIAQTLTRGAESSGKGGYAGRRQEDDSNLVAAMAFQPRFVRNGRGAPDVVASPLTAEAGRTGKGDSAQCIAIQERAVSENLDNGTQGKGYQEGIAYTLEARNKVQAVASQWAVRRLTPTECERLQGFPDGYTQVPHRNKPAADGPRYKALGNSMAVNVMRVLGERIAMVDAIPQLNEEAA